MIRRTATALTLMSGFAVGEEAEQQSGDAVIREVGQVAAPLDHVGAIHSRRDPTARVDVVVRTRKIGHFFPGGTVDAFDVWLELQGTRCRWPRDLLERPSGGRRAGVRWNRARISIRAYQLDGDGNQINKRNAWQARSVLYVRLIPPGAADVAHYLVTIPKDAKGPITFTAKLNYRKFSLVLHAVRLRWPAEAGPGSGAADSQLQQPGIQLRSAAISRQNVSGEDQRPDSRSADRHRWRRPKRSCTARASQRGRPWSRKEDRERWNDWGIGLLLQGDLKGAEYAFTKVTEAEPGYADGWLNVARALIQEGETDAAKPYHREGARNQSDSSAASGSSRPLIEKADGDYDGALQVAGRHAGHVSARPRGAEPDRAHSVSEAQVRRGGRGIWNSVCDVDPEDLQMHYTRDAVLTAAWATRRAPRASRSCSSASKPTNPRRRSPPSRACSAPKTTTSASRFTITKACR